MISPALETREEYFATTLSQSDAYYGIFAPLTAHSKVFVTLFLDQFWGASQQQGRNHREERFPSMVSNSNIHNLTRVCGTHRNRSISKLVSESKAEQVWSDLLVAIFITVERYKDGSIGQHV